MTFDALINKSLSEDDLLRQITELIQANYLALENSYVFFKIEKSEGANSHIAWTKSFADVYDLGDFYFDTKYERACIMVKSIEDHYEILFQGYSLSDRYKIWPDKTRGSRPIIGSFSFNKIPMISQEVLEGAFGEIKAALSSPK